MKKKPQAASDIHDSGFFAIMYLFNQLRFLVETAEPVKEEFDKSIFSKDKFIMLPTVNQKENNEYLKNSVRTRCKEYWLHALTICHERCKKKPSKPVTKRDVFVKKNYRNIEALTNYMKFDEEEKCSICIETLVETPQPTVVYPCCGHTCHLACVLEYMWTVENTYVQSTRQYGLAAQCGSCR